MLATRLGLIVMLALAAFGCGKEDRTAPPRNPGGGAGRDGGPAGAGGAGRDGGVANVDAGPACLRAGGAGSLTTLEGGRVVGTVDGAFTVETLEATVENATTTLSLEVFGGDPDIDAGGGTESYRVELIMTALPRDQVRIGDVIGIVWNAADSSAGPSTTLIVTRDEGLLFFAAQKSPEQLDGESLLPELEPFGIAIGSGEMTCDFAADGCSFREHALAVKSGDETGAVSETGLVRVGDLTAAGRVIETVTPGDDCTSPAGTLVASGFMKRL